MDHLWLHVTICQSMVYLLMNRTFLVPRAPRAAARRPIAHLRAPFKSVGIDLGTSDSAIAIIQDGHAYAIPVEGTSTSMPSVVHYSAGGKVSVVRTVVCPSRFQQCACRLTRIHIPRVVLPKSSAARTRHSASRPSSASWAVPGLTPRSRPSGSAVPTAWSGQQMAAWCCWAGGTQSCARRRCPQRLSGPCWTAWARDCPLGPPVRIRVWSQSRPTLGRGRRTRPGGPRRWRASGPSSCCRSAAPLLARASAPGCLLTAP